MPDSETKNSNPHTSQTVTVSLSSLKEILQNTNTLSITDIADNTQIPNGREIILIVRGMIERFILAPQGRIKLGRFEPAVRQPNELDLTPYGAADRGVSRYHACIQLEDNQLFVVDQGSTNGTYLKNVKVTPETPTLLNKGDELMLGRLLIQVMFR